MAKAKAETAGQEPPLPTITDDYDTVINVSKSGGHITNMRGERVPVGGSCKLPVKICESLVSRGVCKYPSRAESSGE